MRPLHDLIFSILKVIHQDGTFNQLKPIENLLKSVPKRTPLYSFDLSSATDRIPLELQVQILSFLIGEKLAFL